MELGDLIKKQRTAQGMTQRELAARVGVNFTYISKIETGNYETPPSLALLRLISYTLLIDPVELQRVDGRVDCNRLKALSKEHAVIARLLLRLTNGNITLAQIEQIDKILSQ